MARTIFRVNLTASSFPMLSKHYGDSVAGRGRLDTDYVITNQYSGSQADAFIGIPTFIYMHNCVPYTHGVQSLGFREIAGGFRGSTEFDHAYTLRYGTEKAAIFVGAKGRNYVNQGHGWQSVEAPFRMAGTVTIAYLKETTYICYQGNGIYKLNPSTGQITPVVLQGLNTSSLKGITAANAYLIAYDENTIYFSDPTDELNFQPTLSSGAGSESVLQIRGKIVCALPIENGFIIYTTTNAVSAVFSGESRFPWVYREIDGSSGIQKPEHVAWTSNYAGHYAWTTAGLQSISVQTADIVFPEVSDFLAGRELEDYVGDLGLFPGNSAKNSSAGPFGEFLEMPVGPNQLLINKLPETLEQMQIKVAMISSRYLVVSYGLLELTHALIYDIGLKRWGKIRKKHVAVFEYFNLETGMGLAKKTLALLDKSGKISLATVDNASDVDKSDSVVMLGRIQPMRGQNADLLAVESSVLHQTKGQLAVIASLNGSDYLPEIKPVIVDAGFNKIVHQMEIFGRNFILKYTGDFQLNSIQAVANITRGA